MKKYIKPSIINFSNTRSVIPAALLAGGLAATAAFAVGVASGLMKGDDRNIKNISMKTLSKCI